MGSMTVAGVLAGFDLSTLVVTAIGDDFDLFRADLGACLLGHAGKLTAVGADVGDLVRDDQMVRRVDGGLHVVADYARAAPLAAIERESGSVNEIC